MKFIITLIFGMILMVIAALFSGANDQLIKVDYLFGEGEWYLSYLLVFSFFIGISVILLILLPSLLKIKAQKMQKNRTIKKLQAELENLKNSQQQMKLLN